MSGVNDIRAGFLNYFAKAGHEAAAVVAAGAAQRPDPDVHQCRHGAVQERLHRPGEAALPARRDLAEMRARRRQAQRPRQCRLHRAASHLLRDARQLLVRRLLQGPRDRARLEPGHQGIRAAEGQAHRDRLCRRRRSVQSLEEDRRAPRAAHHPHRRLRQLLADGRHRPVRPVLGNLLRPRRQDPRRAAGLARRRGRPLHRDLESRVHAVRAACRRLAHQPAAAVDRHRHGARADRRRAAGHPRQLFDRPVPRADRRHRRTHESVAGRRAEGVAPRDRRSSARVVVPDRRRRAAVERRPRLRAPPHHAPRHAARRTARRARAADVEARAGAGARDGPGLSGTAARRGADQRDAEARGNPLPQDAGARAHDPRRGDQGAEAGRQSEGRHRVHALRHLRLSARSHPGRAAPARHRRRRRGLQRVHGTAEGQGARLLGRLRARLPPRPRGFRSARSSARPSSWATRPRPRRASSPAWCATARRSPS